MISSASSEYTKRKSGQAPASSLHRFATRLRSIRVRRGNATSWALMYISSTILAFRYPFRRWRWPFCLSIATRASSMSNTRARCACASLDSSLSSPFSITASKPFKMLKTLGSELGVSHDSLVWPRRIDQGSITDSSFCMKRAIEFWWTRRAQNSYIPLIRMLHSARFFPNLQLIECCLQIFEDMAGEQCVDEFTQVWFAAAADVLTVVVLISVRQESWFYNRSTLKPGFRRKLHSP